MSSPTLRVPDALKAFVFSAQMAHADLTRLETELGIPLGHAALESSDTDEAYYPQFDEDVRREAAEMSRHYEVFYAQRMQKEADAAVTVRSPDAIDYTTFGELGEIIKSNWDLFGGIFNSQRAVERVMANLNTLRAPIAHCSRLAEDEILRLQLSMRDWFRQMS